MFEIPIHPLHGELHLHCKRWRLLGGENNCGLLLKTLRGSLKKAVAMQEVACSVFDSWQPPCPSHMMPLHLDGTLTYCGKVWVGFFLFALTHRGPWVPFTKFLQLFEQMSKSLWVWSDPKCLYSESRVHFSSNYAQVRLLRGCLNHLVIRFRAPVFSAAYHVLTEILSGQTLGSLIPTLDGEEGTETPYPCVG